MSLERQIRRIFKAAMFAKNATALASIRGSRQPSCWQKRHRMPDELTDARHYQNHSETCKAAQRERSHLYRTVTSELAEAELAEAAIMEKYLPVQMSEEEVEEALKR